MEKLNIIFRAQINLYFYIFVRIWRSQEAFKFQRRSQNREQIVFAKNLWKISVARCRYLIGVVTLIRSPLIEFLGCLSGWSASALIEYKISSGKYRAFSITGHGRDPAGVDPSYDTRRPASAEFSNKLCQLRPTVNCQSRVPILIERPTAAKFMP